MESKMEKFNSNEFKISSKVKEISEKYEILNELFNYRQEGVDEEISQLKKMTESLIDSHYQMMKQIEERDKRIEERDKKFDEKFENLANMVRQIHKAFFDST